MSPNDPTRVREEKARLYQNAVDAWQKGEVAAALASLERLAALDRESPDPDAGNNTYRSFYAQVHAESDAIKKAYEEARGLLAQGNLEGSQALCRQYLAKYPGNPLFHSLQAEIDGRQHQQAQPVAQAIVETERKVEDETNLDRRVAILEDAARRYPGEAHFINSLQAARDLRDVVNSMIEKARFFEERGQLADALDQWQILKSIYPKQPNLAAEIQRLSAPPAAPAPPAPPAPKPSAPPPLKSEWADHARKYLDAGDYQRAAQAVAIGLGESPGHPELMAIDAQVRAGQQSATRALDLLGKAHDLINKGSMDEGLAALREAHALDPRNAVIRTVLVNGLLEQAQKKVDTDLGGAEMLVQEVLRIDPNQSLAQVLAQGIAGRKSSLQPVAPAPVPPAPVPPIPSATGLRQAPTLAVPVPPLSEPMPKAPAPPPPPPPAQPVAAKPKPPAQPVAAKPKPPAPVRPPAAPGQPKKLLIGTAIAVVLLVVVALGVTLIRNRKKPQPVATGAKYAVVLHSSPEGAEIKVSGNSCGVTTCSLNLPAGTYQISATLSGYQEASQPLVIGPGSAKDVNVTLSPQGPRVAIFSDLAEGTVSLDSSPAGQIQGGGAEVANLAAGKHVLDVKGGDSEASIPIEISPGAAPALSGNITAKNGRCFLVAAFGTSARVYGSGTGYRVTLDGKALGALAPAGLPLEGLTPGTHELAMDSDTGQHDRMDFSLQPSATLYVSLMTAQNLGTLSIETNEDQAHVIINGQRYKRDTARGRLVLYLFPRKYTVSVQKDGFAPAVEQTVEVKKGQDSKLSFTLAAAKCILAVHHAPPGTDVQVDNISRGTAHADGEFQVGGIDPGRHTVTLRHEGFKPMQSDQIFLAGRTLDLQAALEAVPTTGTLRFEISPPGVEAHIRIHRDGDAQEREVSGPSVNVPEGRYVVSVSAPQYAPTTASVQVTAGGTAVAAVTLRRAEPAKTAPKTAALLFGLEDWLKVPGWSVQNGLLVHKGGDWVMAPPDISTGTIRFTVVSIKGRHVEWAVASRDEKNFIHYELDDKNLTRYEVRNGSKLGQVKVPHGLDKKKPMGFSMSLTPQSVVTSVFHGGWVEIDKWDVTGSTIHGRFGFRIPGSDEIGLQDFQIIP